MTVVYNAYNDVWHEIYTCRVVLGSPPLWNVGRPMESFSADTLSWIHREAAVRYRVNKLLFMCHSHHQLYLNIFRNTIASSDKQHEWLDFTFYQDRWKTKGRFWKCQQILLSHSSDNEQCHTHWLHCITRSVYKQEGSKCVFLCRVAVGGNYREDSKACWAAGHLEGTWQRFLIPRCSEALHGSIML